MKTKYNLAKQYRYLICLGDVANGRCLKQRKPGVIEFQDFDDPNSCRFIYNIVLFVFAPKIIVKSL